MVVDFKITTWERVSVPQEMVQEVINAIESGEIRNSTDLLDLFEEVTFEGILEETSEQMLIEENDGQATIEVINISNNNSIYTNIR